MSFLRKNWRSIPIGSVIVGSIIGIILIIIFWYVALPVGAIILVWKKTKLEKKKKIQATIGLSAVMLILISMMFYLNRPPSITITEPKNDTTIQEKETKIKGFVVPKNASIEINGETVGTNNGNFIYPILLSEGGNQIKIKAETWFIKEVTLTIKRKLSEAEKEARAQTEAKAKEEQAQTKAKTEAEQREWEQSKAGQICKAHPEWTKEDCNLLVAGKIWIGMEYEMLVYRWGEPDHDNISNYGSGIRHQYCWDDYTPKCYYDDNNDGIIDAYN